MSKGKQHTSVLATIAIMASLLVPMAMVSTAAAAPPGDVGAPQTSFKICRGDVAAVTEYVPNPYGDGYICVEATPSNYSGDAGKGWAELDLVPFRIVLTTGADEAQTYPFGVAVDYLDNGIPGYDYITMPSVNTALSTGTCSPLTDVKGGPGDAAILPDNDGLRLKTPGFTNGTEASLYRLETINIGDNSTCVIDFDARLAIGAHSFPGASLHGNVTDGNGSGTNQDRSINPKEIEPQSISKDMTAVRDVDHTWNIIKSATPFSIDLGDTCATPSPSNDTVEITVTWTKGEATPSGMTHITANIYATNPAHRTITVDVSDVVYQGTGQADADKVHTSAPGSLVLDVPPNTTGALVGTDEFDVATTADTVNDVATASYIDTDLGIPVPGTTEATATAPVTVGNELNTEAVITDVESITGTGLSFSVDATSGATGTFDGSYALGDVVPASTDLTWTSASQSAGGSVTFDKTVYFAGSGDATGSLDDTASFATNGTPPATGSADGTISITSSTLATLTIEKSSTADVEEATAFKFKVYEDSGIPDDPDTDNVDESLGDFVGDVTVNFAAGDDSGTGTLGGLDDGDYIIVETDAGLFTPAGNAPFTVGAGECAVSVPIENGFGLATATAQKVTVPDSASPEGFEFTLYLDDDETPGAGDPNNDTPYAVDTSDANGLVDFGGVQLTDEGDYYILETGGPAGFDGSVGEGCVFNVQYPRDADGTFDDCVITNTLRGTIIVEKQTTPDGSTDEFEFTGDAADTIVDGEQIIVTDLAPGQYDSTETLVADDGWTLDSIVCDDDASDTPSTGDTGTGTATFNLDAGETVTCVFNNSEAGTIEVEKTFNGAPDATKSFVFQLRENVDIHDPLNPADDDEGSLIDTQTVTADGNPVQLDGFLTPGTYTVCEVLQGPGWTIDLGGGEYILVKDLVNDRVCADFEVGAGEKVTVTADNVPPPGGQPLTIGFWKNHASCRTSGGNQAPVLDDVLKTFPLGGPLTPQTHGFFVGTLWVDTCAEARNLLDKKPAGTVGKGKKAANDALINLAAQYVAAKLNIQGGAGTCSAINTAMAAATTLFNTTGFDGSAATPLTAAQKTQANSLATTIDQYNNGLLC